MARLGEFELIDRFFTRPARRVRVGVGDDCALLAPAPGHELAVSTDLLIEGRHFVSTVAPERLGHKALAVNLSDLAACGARPLAFTLALALPDANSAFLEPFARGLFALADVFDCELVGGDTTRGPLAVCITVFGDVEAGRALLRSGARPGDDVWVSGTLGDARLALEVLRGRAALDGDGFARVRRRMEEPEPRVALGLALAGRRERDGDAAIASSAIDVSDGFAGDLGHVLARSRVGATIDVDALPLGDDVRERGLDARRELALAGGDDYELVFTAAAGRREAVAGAAAAAGTAVTRVGRIDAEPGLRLIDAAGRAVAVEMRAFDHFRA